jgi:hypothetical protein
MPKRRPALKKKSKKSKKTTRTSKPKPEVSRHEYAQLCLHLATVESLATRNRTDLDIQLRRIAQLQDELDRLKKTQD